MNDRPTAPELIDAVRQFLELEVIPSLEDQRLRFQTLIAAHVLGVVGRELPIEEDRLREEWAALTKRLGETGTRPDSLAGLRQEVLQLNRMLCDRIRAGDHDEPARFRDLLAALKGQVMRKLEVANPKYLANATVP